MATLYQKTKLFKGLLTGEVAYTGPFYVTVNLTSRCNLRCLGCRYHSPFLKTAIPDHPPTLDIPLSIMEKLCKELKPMNTHAMVLQGAGEPVLHPDFPDLVTVVKKAGFHTTLLTNGTLLGTDLIQTFIDWKFDVVKVTLWATSPEEYEQNYPGTDPDNFKKVIEGMKRMAELKADQKSKVPSVILHFPINRNNYQGIDALGDLALTTGCHGLSFAPMNDEGGVLDPFALSPDEERSARQTLSRLRKRLNSHSLNHNIDQTLLRYKLGQAVWRKMPCYAPWFHARITEEGAVQPCGRCNLSFGNLENSTFREIWNGSAFRAFRSKAIRSDKVPLLREQSNCSFCCLAGDNAQVHRFFKRFLPFLRHPNKELSCPKD
jgi:MoaA/NifB/PqqE/SkfB family radical SAM enzyme